MPHDGLSRAGASRSARHERAGSDAGPFASRLPAAAVIERLREACAAPAHEFWPDDASILDSATFDASRTHGPRQVTDLYLLALAVRHAGLRHVRWRYRRLGRDRRERPPSAAPLAFCLRKQKLNCQCGSPAALMASIETNDWKSGGNAPKVSSCSATSSAARVTKAPIRRPSGSKETMAIPFRTPNDPFETLVTLAGAVVRSAEPARFAPAGGGRAGPALAPSAASRSWRQRAADWLARVYTPRLPPAIQAASDPKARTRMLLARYY